MLDVRLKVSLAALAAALASAFPTADAEAADFHRCTIDGVTRYQQSPCPGTGKTVSEDMREKEARSAKLREEAERLEADRQRAEQANSNRWLLPPPTASGSLREIAEQSARRAREREEATQKLIDADKAKYCPDGPVDIRLGMSEDELIACTPYRYVDGRNELTSAGGVTTQLHFKLWRTFVHLRNGVVTSWQTY